jgi:hypothetical protein
MGTKTISGPASTSPEPERGERCADQVEAGTVLGRGIGDPARENEDGEDDQHLVRENPAPGEVRREEPPDERPERDRDRTRSRDETVGGRPALDREVPGDERDDGGHDQRGADPFEERPAEQQDGETRRERGRERPGSVDDTAERECPLPADQGSDLGAGKAAYFRAVAVETEARASRRAQP